MLHELDLDFPLLPSMLAVDPWIFSWVWGRGNGSEIQKEGERKSERRTGRVNIHLWRIRQIQYMAVNYRTFRISNGNTAAGTEPQVPFSAVTRRISNQELNQ